MQSSQKRTKELQISIPSTAATTRPRDHSERNTPLRFNWQAISQPSRNTAWECRRRSRRAAWRRARARCGEAVGARHSKPDGAREKAAKLKAIWEASTPGEYATKEKCAEIAGAQVGLKFDAAKKALTNVARKKAFKQTDLPCLSLLA